MQKYKFIFAAITAIMLLLVLFSFYNSNKKLNEKIIKLQSENTELKQKFDTLKNNSEKIGKDQIKQLLKEALQADLLERSRKSIDNKVAISSTLEEFMKCFIVLGYDMNGNPINLVHANSQQDADSLSTAVNKFFVQNNNPDMF